MESGRTAAGVLLGIGVGALLGMLFAPEKGSETRKKIMDKGQGFADDIKGKFNEIYEEVSDKSERFLEEAKKEATTLK